MPEIEENRLSLIGYPFPEIKRVEEIFSTLKSDAALLEEAKRYALKHGEKEAICAMILDEIADDVLPEPKK